MKSSNSYLFISFLHSIFFITHFDFDPLFLNYSSSLHFAVQIERILALHSFVIFLGGLIVSVCCRLLSLLVSIYFKLVMDNNGEAVDDQGLGWFQVKKVFFLSFVNYSHCLVDKEAKKEERILCFMDASSH